MKKLLRCGQCKFWRKRRDFYRLFQGEVIEVEICMVCTIHNMRKLKGSDETEDEL